MSQSFFEVEGIIHLHSRYSDGSGEVPDIMKDAQDSLLDFVIFTDHNTLRPKKDGWEGWYGNSLAVFGCELNDKNDQNHLLVVGIDDIIHKNKTAPEYVTEVVEGGGVCFLAHPHEKRATLPQYPPYPWTAWESDNFTGIEIWNHMSDWMEGLTEENKYNRFVHPLRSMTVPPKETIRKWDELNRDRLVVGVGGSDCHAIEQEIMGVTVQVFPYKVGFRAIRTHLLLEKPLSKDNTVAENIALIVSALKKGRCFVVNHYRGAGKGFRFWFEGKNTTLYPGDRFSAGQFTVKIFSPEKRQIRLLKDGQVIFTAQESDHLVFSVSESGVYRTELFFGDTGWIYSNPITLV